MEHLDHASPPPPPPHFNDAKWRVSAPLFLNRWGLIVSFYFLFILSNIVAFYHECCSLIGWAPDATHYSLLENSPVKIDWLKNVLPFNK